MSHTIEGKPWGGADRERGLAFHFSAADLHRLGNNPQNPKPGDLCIVDRHIGDHFHTYIVCRRRSDGLHAPGTTLTEALDSLLEHKRRDDFEILMVNSAGQIVRLQPKD